MSGQALLAAELLVDRNLDIHLLPQGSNLPGGACRSHLVELIREDFEGDRPIGNGRHQLAVKRPVVRNPALR